MKTFPSRPFGSGRWRLSVFCATCGEDVRTFSIAYDDVMDLRIRLRARHHGLYTETAIDGELVACRTVTFVDVFPLAARALAPIAPPPPPKRRGRFLPAPDASRTVVWNVGPMEVIA